jgi:hypothetical protein
MEMENFKLNFKNTIKLILKETPTIKLVKRVDIFEALLEKTNDRQLGNKIDYISQFNKRNIWFVTFKKDYDISLLLYEKIKIKNEEYLILNVMDTYIYNMYKISWLPHNMNLEQVKDFFRKKSHQIEVLECKEDYCKEKGMQNIKNGIVSIRVRILKTEIETANIESGIYNFISQSTSGFNGVTFNKDYSFKILLRNLSDAFAKCLLCNSGSHLRTSCLINQGNTMALVKNYNNNQTENYVVQEESIKLIKSSKYFSVLSPIQEQFDQNQNQIINENMVSVLENTSLKNNLVDNQQSTEENNYYNNEQMISIMNCDQRNDRTSNSNQYDDLNFRRNNL